MVVTMRNMVVTERENGVVTTVAMIAMETRRVATIVEGATIVTIDLIALTTAPTVIALQKTGGTIG